MTRLFYTARLKHFTAIPQIHLYRLAQEKMNVICFTSTLNKIFKNNLLISGFYPHDAMLAWVLAMALCLSLSVCHKSVFHRNGWTDSAGCWHLGFFPPTLHCVVRKFRYLQKRALISVTFSKTPDL